MHTHHIRSDRRVASEEYAPLVYGHSSKNIHVVRAVSAEIQPATTSPPRLGNAGDVIIVGDLSAATTTIIVSESSTVASGGAKEFCLSNFQHYFSLSADQQTIGVQQSYQPSPQVTKNPILEMRSTRRSLRDKAQEEMSDFEREYPW